MYSLIGIMPLVTADLRKTSRTEEKKKHPRNSICKKSENSAVKEGLENNMRKKHLGKESFKSE